MLFRRPFIKRFTLCHRTAVCLSVLSCLSVCDVGVLWPNGCMDQDAIWCEVGLGPGRIMLDRDQVPPIFGPRGHPFHPPNNIRVRAVVWECGEGQTDIYRDGRDQYTFRLGYTSRAM